ncbi:MAG TPA: hypothetical protein VFO82_06995 [Steroidobacteraceae bacterium]|nr:hypothetical protein [Steroidobacteraceae bacterium]
MFKWVVVGLATIIVAAVGAWWYERYRAQAALLEQPVYRVLQKHERMLFEDLVNEYRLYRRDEVSRGQFINFANAEISLVATRALAHASQDSLLALVGDMVATAKTLQTVKGDACFRYWFPKVDGPPDVAQLVDARAQARTLELMGEVIRSAAESPVPLPAPEGVKENLAAIINATYEQFGTDAQMLAHAEDPRADRAKVCTITISLYERILRLPPREAGELIRAMTQVQ